MIGICVHVRCIKDIERLRRTSPDDLVRLGGFIATRIIDVTQPRIPRGSKFRVNKQMEVEQSPQCDVDILNILFSDATCIGCGCRK